MAEIPPLNIKVIVDASGATVGVAKVSAGLDQLSAKAQVTKSRMAGLGATFKTLAGGLIATGGIIALSNALGDIRQGAIDVEVQTNRLNNVLTNIGETAQRDSGAVLDYANSFSKLGFAGEDAIGAMSTLVTSTGSVAQAQKLMGVTADYARDKQIPLAAAATAMARATQGNMKAFMAYGITLDQTLPKNEAIAKAFDELNKKIGGSALKYTDTFAGRMLVLKERFEDFVEMAIMPLLPYLTKFAGILVNAAEWISKNSDALKIYGGIILVVTTYLKGMAIISAIIAGINPFTWIVIGVTALGIAFVKTWNNFEGFRKAMATGLGVVVAAIGYMVGGLSKFLGVLAKIPGMGFLKGVAESASDIALNLGKAAGSIEKMSNKKLTVPKIPTMPDFVKPGDKTGITGNVTGGDTTGGKGGSGTIQYVTIYASNTNDIAKKLAKAAKNGQPIGGGK
jgi:hypothetical protein